MNIDRALEIQKYRDQKKALRESGEGWRVRFENEEDFIQKLDEIIYNSHNSQYINDKHREHTVRLSIEILHQRNLSKEEMVTQMLRHKEAAKASFAKQAPKIKAYAKTLESPLPTSLFGEIYRWISRNQIELSDFPEDVRVECLQNEMINNLLNKKSA